MINDSLTDLDDVQPDDKGITLLSPTALQEILNEDLEEKYKTELKIIKRRKKCQICYTISSYGFCPFQLELANFNEFLGETTFINSRMIIVSCIALAIIFGFYVNLIRKFGTIYEQNRDIKNYLSEPFD